MMVQFYVGDYHDFKKKQRSNDETTNYSSRNNKKNKHFGLILNFNKE